MGRGRSESVLAGFQTSWFKYNTCTVREWNTDASSAYLVVRGGILQSPLTGGGGDLLFYKVKLIC